MYDVFKFKMILFIFTKWTLLKLQSMIITSRSLKYNFTYILFTSCGMQGPYNEGGVAEWCVYGNQWSMVI